MKPEKKTELLIKLGVIKDMTEVEGVRQLVDILEEILSVVGKDEIGFKQ